MANTVTNWLIDQELDKLAALDPNWDSYGALPIDPAIIAAVKALVEKLYFPLRPAVVPTVSGGVRLEWHAHPRSLEIEIADPQTIQYVKWEPPLEEEDVFSIDDVERIQALIQWFFERGETSVTSCGLL